VRTPVDVFSKVLDALLHREVEQYSVVVIRSEIRGVSLFCLEAPHEARAPVREGVDLIEPSYEASHHWTFERSFHPRNIHLGEVPVGSPF
jgi:hypothetical protein